MITCLQVVWVDQRCVVITQLLTRQTVEEANHVASQSLRDLHESTNADPVGAEFVLLDLLIRDADLTTELLQGDTTALADLRQVLTDADVKGVIG